MYYDATNQTLGHWGVFSPSQALCFTMQLGCIVIYTLGGMNFLEYIGFILAIFTLKCGFIIVQIHNILRQCYTVNVGLAQAPLPIMSHMHCRCTTGRLAVYMHGLIKDNILNQCIIAMYLMYSKNKGQLILQSFTINVFFVILVHTWRSFNH